MGKWGSDWALGYALTVHSSQGLTIEDPPKGLDHRSFPSVVESRLSGGQPCGVLASARASGMPPEEDSGEARS